MNSSEPKGKPRKRKSSPDGSENTSNLKKQVEQAKDLAATAIEKILNDPDITFPEAMKQIKKASRAFKIMDNAIELEEQMKKLKDEK